MPSNLPAILCDLCHNPGACCRDFPLSARFPETMDVPNEWHQFALRNEGANGPLLQFEPVRPMETGDGTWRFKCNALQPNGRCGMYENRPHACRNYEAESDRLCVMYREKPHVEEDQEAMEKAG